MTVLEWIGESTDFFTRVSGFIVYIWKMDHQLGRRYLWRLEEREDHVIVLVSAFNGQVLCRSVKTANSKGDFWVGVADDGACKETHDKSVSEESRAQAWGTLLGGWGNRPWRPGEPAGAGHLTRPYLSRSKSQVVTCQSCLLQRCVSCHAAHLMMISQSVMILFIRMWLSPGVRVFVQSAYVEDHDQRCSLS